MPAKRKILAAFGDSCFEIPMGLVRVLRPCNLQAFYLSTSRFKGCRPPFSAKKATSQKKRASFDSQCTYLDGSGFLMCHSLLTLLQTTYCGIIRLVGGNPIPQPTLMVFVPRNRLAPQAAFFSPQQKGVHVGFGGLLRSLPWHQQTTSEAPVGSGLCAAGGHPRQEGPRNQTLGAGGESPFCLTGLLKRYILPI